MTPTVPLLSLLMCAWLCMCVWVRTCACPHVPVARVVARVCDPVPSNILHSPASISRQGFPGIQSKSSESSLPASATFSVFFHLHSYGKLADSSTQPFTWVQRKSQMQTLYLLFSLSRECCLPLVKAKLRLGVREVDFLCVPP